MWRRRINWMITGAVGAVVGVAASAVWSAARGAAPRQSDASGILSSIERIPQIGTGNIYGSGDYREKGFIHTYHWGGSESSSRKEKINGWLDDVESWCSQKNVNITGRVRMETTTGAVLALGYEMHGVSGTLFCLGERKTPQSTPECLVVVNEASHVASR